MADLYTWDKAKQAGYKIDVVPITRQTIADGNLLNSDIVEVFSSRDQYLIDNANNVNASATSVYNTVKNNSATNWNNALLTGFSAIQFNNLAAVGKSYASGTLTWTFDYPFTITTATDKVTISAKNLNESYFQLAKSANSTVSYPDITNEPPRGSNKGLAGVFGENCKLPADLVTYHIDNTDLLFDNSETESYHAIAFVYSKASQAGFSFNQSTGSYYAGIGFNKSNDCSGAGIGINTSKGTRNGIAINNSTSLGRAFSFYNSYAESDGAAYIASVGEWRGIGLIHSTAYYAGLAYINSVGRNNGLAVVNATAQTASFAVSNSIATEGSIALANSTATEASFALCSSYTDTDGVAFNKSSAHSHSLAFINSSAICDGFAICDSTANSESFAFHTSYAYNGSFAFAASTALYGAYASLGSSANNGSVAVNNSTANNGSVCINASYNALGLRSIAMYQSYNYASTGKYADFMVVTQGPTVWNTPHNILSYNSKLYAYTATWHGVATAAANGPFHLGNNIALYNSSAATFGNTITMHESVTSGFVGNSIAMYNSKIIATGELPTELYKASNIWGLNDRENNYYDASAHKYVAALYNSTLSLDNSQQYITPLEPFSHKFIDSVIVLWNNTVFIEPYNIINGVKLVTSTVGLKPLDAFKPRYATGTDRESNYMKQRHIVYIGF